MLNQEFIDLDSVRLLLLQLAFELLSRSLLYAKVLQVRMQ